MNGVISIPELGVRGDPGRLRGLCLECGGGPDRIDRVIESVIGDRHAKERRKQQFSGTDKAVKEGRLAVTSG
jgi:hypothetical protein